jgi:hypothetical protein
MLVAGVRLTIVNTLINWLLTHREEMRNNDELDKIQW